MAEFNSVDIEGDSALTLGNRHDLGRLHKEEFGIRIDEARDEPRAGYSIDLDVLTCDKLHELTPETGSHSPLPHQEL